MLLQNCGDLPLTFCLDHSLNPALAESVFVVPSCGLIQPGSHQILMLRTTPTEDSPKQGFSLHLRLNAAKHTKVLYTRHRNTEDKSSNTPHTVLAGYFICANVSVSFRSWQLSVLWNIFVCLWKETTAYISSQQPWAHERSVPTTSETSAAYLYGWLP